MKVLSRKDVKTEEQNGNLRDLRSEVAPKMRSHFADRQTGVVLIQKVIHLALVSKNGMFRVSVSVFRQTDGLRRFSLHHPNKENDFCHKCDVAQNMSCSLFPCDPKKNAEKNSKQSFSKMKLCIKPHEQFV